MKGGKSSFANFYILPQISINGMILDEWHHQVKKFTMRKFKYLEKVLTKEFHVEKNSKDSPCEDTPELMFYKV